MNSPVLRIVIPTTVITLILSLIITRWISGRLRKGLRIAQIVSAGYLLICLLAYLIPTYGIGLYDAVRPVPASETRQLFQGIEYIRDIRSMPHPIVIHVVKIDLDAPGIHFIVTPPNPSGGRKLRAQTVSQFLQKEGAQLAINGDYFEPWWDNSLVDYYPWPGQPVDVAGFAASSGNTYSDVHANHSTVFITADNRVTFDERIQPIYNAISGNAIIVQVGEPFEMADHPYYQEKHPRTAIGLDQTGGIMILIVIDGRQPGYSEGATMSELAAILIEYGAWTALNLDGGGSATLVMANATGEPLLLSTPIHNHIPYRERPVANHLGVFALPITP